MKKLLILPLTAAIISGCSTTYSNSGVPPMNHSPQNTHFVTAEDMKGDTFTIRIKDPHKNIRISEEITLNPIGNISIKNGEKMDYVAHKVENADAQSFYGLAKVHQADDKNKAIWSGFAGGAPTDDKELPTLAGKSATYTGKVMGTLDRSSDKLYEGDFTAKVDFTKGNGGKITGKLTGDEKGFGGGLTIDGTVNGQFIEGNVTLNGKDADGKESVIDRGGLWGQLNGKEASGMAGHYESEKEDGMVGSFGGSRGDLEKTPAPTPEPAPTNP